MKALNIIITLCFTFLIYQESMGQKIGITDKIISWKAFQQTEMKSMTDVYGKFTIVTRQLQSIDLVQDETKQFRITGINGAWNNLSEDGELEYLVEYQNTPGKVTITRVNLVTTIVIDFSAYAPEDIKSKFLIKSIEY
jgi:hypothetical protein